MVFKTILIGILLTISLFAKSFNFIEDRYSDALGRSISLDGEITFEKDRLFIKYKDSNREILYKDSSLELKDGADILVLAKEESQRMSQYFKIILLLYANDEKELEKKFDIKTENDISVLFPKGHMKDFLQKIVLQKEKNELKEIRLFIQNGDRIVISIKDEIR